MLKLANAFSVSDDGAVLHFTVRRAENSGARKLVLEKSLAVIDVVSGAGLRVDGPWAVTVHVKLSSIDE